MLSPDDILDAEDKIKVLAVKLLEFCKKNIEDEEPPIVLGALGILICSICQASDVSKKDMLDNMDLTWEVLNERENK